VERSNLATPYLTPSPPLTVDFPVRRTRDHATRAGSGPYSKNASTIPIVAPTQSAAPSQSVYGSTMLDRKALEALDEQETAAPIMDAWPPTDPAQHLTAAYLGGPRARLSGTAKR
jgi:hypothetical protein